MQQFSETKKMLFLILCCIKKNIIINKFIWKGNDYEPASFVVETERKLEDVRVEVGMLRSSSATIPGSSVDVRVVIPCYLGPTTPRTLNWVLVHDPGTACDSEREVLHNHAFHA